LHGNIPGEIIDTAIDQWRKHLELVGLVALQVHLTSDLQSVNFISEIDWECCTTE